MSPDPDQTPAEDLPPKEHPVARAHSDSEIFNTIELRDETPFSV